MGLERLIDPVVIGQPIHFSQNLLRLGRVDEQVGADARVRVAKRFGGGASLYRESRRLCW